MQKEEIKEETMIAENIEVIFLFTHPRFTKVSLSKEVKSASELILFFSSLGLDQNSISKFAYGNSKGI